MKRLNYSNFELIEDVISDLRIELSANNVERLKVLSDMWVEVVGNKISQFSKVFEISADNIVTIICSDSFIANELYFQKQKLLTAMYDKVSEQGIEITDLKFNYRKWNKNDD